MSTEDTTLEGSVVDSSASVAPSESEAPEFDINAYLESLAENSEEDSSEPSAGENAEETQTATDESEVDDDSISFSDLDVAESVDPTDFITSRLEDPEVKAAFESLVSDFQSKETGFQKIHDQVTTVKDIAGVQSLNDIAKHYQEFVIPWSEQLVSLGSDEPKARDNAVRSFMQVIAETSGLSVDEVYDIASGIDSPGVKQSTAVSKELALQTLGLTEDALSELTQLKAEKEFVSKYAPAIAKVSEKVGFSIDPARIYDVKKANPNMTDEAAILQAYPNEYKQYLVQKGSKLAGKREAISNAPKLGGRSVTAPGVTLATSDRNEALAIITSAF